MLFVYFILSAILVLIDKKLNQEMTSFTYQSHEEKDENLSEVKTLSFEEFTINTHKVSVRPF